jgi:hypothetical protein
VKEKFVAFLKYLLGAFLLLALCYSLCLATFWYLFWEDYKQHEQARMAPRDCSGLPEAVEWTGILDFIDAPASDTIINEENAARLTPLGTSRLSDSSSRFWRNEPVKHPLHDYILALTSYDRGGSDRTYDLTVCPPDGWSSHILSNKADSIAFSPDGQFFAVDFHSNLEGSIESVILYDAFNIEEIVRLPISGTRVQGFAFHPTESLIAILDYSWREPDTIEQTIAIWNYRSHTRIANYGLDNQQYRDDGYNNIVFNRDGSLLAIQSFLPDKSIMAWGIAPD